MTESESESAQSHTSPGEKNASLVYSAHCRGKWDADPGQWFSIYGTQILQLRGPQKVTRIGSTLYTS